MITDTKIKYNKYKKTSEIVLMILMTSLVTGCWDNVEINNREYIFAVGIDEYDGEEKDQKQFTFTAEFPKINTGSKDERLIFTEKSVNLTQFYSQNLLRTDKVVSDRLMQIVIIGEEVASNPQNIKNIFDEIERSPQINRRVKIAIAKGTAQDIINTEIPNNPITGRYLSDLLVKLKKDNYQSTYTFDDALLITHNFDSGMIPLVEKYEDSLKIERTAILKDYKFIGALEPKESEIIMFLLNPQGSRMENITINLENTFISLSAEDITMTKKINLEGEKLSADYYVTLYCYIDSFTLDEANISQPKLLKEIKDEAIKIISDRTDELIYKLQNTYEADLLRIEEDLGKFQKSKYQKIKDIYNEVFVNADINVHYNVVIKSTGLVK